MRFHAYLLCLLLSLSVITAGDDDVQSSTQTNLEDLKEITERSIPFLKFNDYLRYAVNIDSSYDVITLFTLRNTAGRCQMCDVGFKSLKVLSRALRKKERPIFVVGVDIETERELAMMFKIERMPLIHIRSIVHSLDEFYPINQFLEIELIQKWILRKTGVEVKIKIPTDYKKIVGMALYAAVFLFLLFLVYKYLRRYIGKNLLAIGTVYFCYVFAAGMEYCSINNSPYMIKNGQGELEVLGHGQRDQTVAELYIVLGLYFAIFVGFLILSEIKYVVTWKIFPKGLSMTKRQYIVTLGTFFMVLYSFSYILVLVKHKMGGGYPYSLLLHIIP